VLIASASGPGDVGRLRAFRSLNDFEFDWVSFLQRAIAIASDRGIMYENVWAIIAPDEAVSFGIVKPFHGSLHFACPPDTVFGILHHAARQIILTTLRMARSVAESKFESIEHSSFIATFCGEDKFLFIFLQERFS
jgi:hypothetical protein